MTKQLVPSRMNGVAVPTGRDTKNGTRIPEDWKPTEKGIAYAVTHLGDQRAAAFEAAKFALYWQTKTGRDAVKLKWDLCWQRWVLGAVGYREADARKNQSSSNAIDQALDRARREASERSGSNF